MPSAIPCNMALWFLQTVSAVRKVSLPNRGPLGKASSAKTLEKLYFCVWLMKSSARQVDNRLNNWLWRVARMPWSETGDKHIPIAVHGFLVLLYPEKDVKQVCRIARETKWPRHRDQTIIGEIINYFHRFSAFFVVNKCASNPFQSRKHWNISQAIRIWLLIGFAAFTLFSSASPLASVFTGGSIGAKFR